MLEKVVDQLSRELVLGEVGEGFQILHASAQVSTRPVLHEYNVCILASPISKILLTLPDSLFVELVP